MRFFQHMLLTPLVLKRRCPPSSLEKIEEAIRMSERRHRAEIVFALEPWLGIFSLLRNRPIRERALDSFSKLHVWDTEENTGLLIFLSLAEERVEIIADRGISKIITDEEWSKISRALERAVRGNGVEHAVIETLAEITDKLSAAFPEAPGAVNQLPDEPVIVS